MRLATSIRAVLTASAFIVTTSATAEDAPPGTIPVEPLRTDATPDAEEPRAAPVGLETIVVTGELIARDADQTTSSVAVHTGAEIERSTAAPISGLNTLSSRWPWSPPTVTAW